MDVEQIDRHVKAAVRLAAEGRGRRATRMLTSAMKDGPGDGYVAASVLASLILDGLKPSEAVGTRLGVHTSTNAPPDHPMSDTVTAIAAFVAAEGNGDNEGKVALYFQLLQSESPQAAEMFFAHLFKIAVAAESAS